MSEYRIVKPLGGGTYGKVYSVEEMAGARGRFALKVNYKPKTVKGIGAIREMVILQQIKEHPFCLQTKDVLYLRSPFGDLPTNSNNCHDKVYFLMEEGHFNARTFLISPSTDWADRKLFMVQLLLAIEYIHSRGIYHRDLKPDNILCFMNPAGSLEKIQVGDFGLANYICSQEYSSNNVVTLWYRAPEILLGKKYDLRSDIWSVGCIFYELLTQKVLICNNQDSEAMARMLEILPCPTEDQTLAQKLHNVRPNNDPKDLSKLVGLNQYQIAQFDSQSLAGKPNSGTYQQMLDLLGRLLTLNPKIRLTASQALSHPFFSGHRRLISQTRSRVGINGDGQFVLEPRTVFKYTLTQSRKVGAKLFKQIYNRRTEKTFSPWYSHRILFHAIDLFDRYLTTQPDKPDRSIWEINVIVRTVLYISIKFFLIMQDPPSLESLTWGINESEIPTFVEHVVTMESYLVRNVFQNRIYFHTVYEEADIFLTEVSIRRLFQLILDGELSSGISVRKVWDSHRYHLKDLNSIPSAVGPISTTFTPVFTVSQ